MAEVRTSSQCESPCAGIEETRKPPGDAGGSSSPVNGDDHTGKRLAGKPHEPFERADGGRAKARPPPTLQELVETALGMVVDDAADHVSQIGPRLDAQARVIRFSFV